MRLFTRLLISHTIPALIMTVALGVASISLLRVGFVLTTLSETELATLHDEGELHRAAWGLDVAMRHALIACARGEQPQEVRRLLTSASAELNVVYRNSGRVPKSMRNVVDGYLGTVEDVVARDSCEALIGTTVQSRRAELDEQLTNLWVDRLRELHRAVNAKEDDARRVAVTAATLGMPLAGLSFLFALWIARQMARKVEEPLALLAHSAQRVGRGDFSTPVEVAMGPPEIRALAADFERMRTELKQIEALKQGFLASVSHELRTPLSKIREGLALLSDGALGPLDDRKMRVVQIARSACEREIRMVTTLLDLSRLRAGNPIAVRTRVALVDVLEAAVDDERPEAQQRGVALDFDGSGTGISHDLDAALFERAVANVVRNGVAVSSRGQTVSVRVAVDPQATAEHPYGKVRIIITDAGPGVPDEIRETLFDAFVTRSVPNSSKALGIGIGLALAREVARAHGGDLLLREPVGRGAVFELWLPLGEHDLEGEPAAPSDDLTP